MEAVQAAKEDRGVEEEAERRRERVMTRRSVRNGSGKAQCSEWSRLWWYRWTSDGLGWRGVARGSRGRVAVDNGGGSRSRADRLSWGIRSGFPVGFQLVSSRLSSPSSGPAPLWLSCLLLLPPDPDSPPPLILFWDWEVEGDPACSSWPSVFSSRVKPEHTRATGTISGG